MRQRRLAGWCIATLVGAGLVVVAAPPASADGVATVPRPDHVVIVVEENHSNQSILGNPSAPYINSLAANGANMSKFFAETHPSQPNYLALFSGGMQGVTDDSCPHTFTVPTLGSELIDAGAGFAGYSEGLPSVGYTGCGSGGYARKHNPWVDFSNIPASANQPFSAFPSDYSQLPAVSFVMPNLTDDMHDGTIAQGDAWLQNNLDGYVQWAQTHNSVFVLTFDEDDGSQTNQIATILTGQRVQAGVYNSTLNHYNLLRTVEDAYGLAPVGASATAAPIIDVWTPPAGDQPPVAAFSSSCVGLSCSFDASGSSDPDGSIASYSWSFGDGSSGSGVSASHAYGGGGARSVVLTVTDDAGASASVSHVVSPVGAPGVLAADGFARSVSNGWGSADSGGSWVVSGAASAFSVGGGVGVMRPASAGAGATALLSGVSAANVNVLVDVGVDKVATGNGLSVIVETRHTGGGDYRLKLRLLAGGVVHLAWSKVVAGRESTFGEVAVKLTYAGGDVLRLRAVVLGSGSSTALSGRVWKVGGVEPAAAQISFSDSDAALQGAGTVGLQTGLGSTVTNAPITASYANFSVTNSATNQAPVAAFTSQCSQLSCQFNGSGSTDSDGTVAGYSWTFGDGATGSGPSATHAYVSPGDYVATLVVTDDQGATGTVSHTVTASPPPVNQPPTARFTFTCAQLSCSFDGSPSSDPEDVTVAAWAWDFGDQGGDTGATPNHTFPSAATYVVRLVVTDDDGATDAVTHSVTVTGPPPPNQPPVAAFSSSCVGLSCSFDASGSSDPDGSIASYSWSFGDGSSGSGVSASHAYGGGGARSVVLTVTDDAGASASVSHVVSPVGAPGVLAADGFARSVSNGWGSADSGGSWVVSGAASAFSVGGGVGVMRPASAGAGATALLSGVSAANVNVLVDVGVDKVATGNGLSVIVETRHTGGGDYRLKLRLLAGGVVHLAWSKVVAGRESTFGEVAVKLTYAGGDVLRLRAVVLGSGSSTALSGRVWKVGGVEPAAAQISFSDSDAALQGAGTVGLQTGLGSTVTNAPITASYANFSVTNSATNQAQMI